MACLSIVLPKGEDRNNLRTLPMNLFKVPSILFTAMSRRGKRGHWPSFYFFGSDPGVISSKSASWIFLNLSCDCDGGMGGGGMVGGLNDLDLATMVITL